MGEGRGELQPPGLGRNLLGACLGRSVGGSWTVQRLTGREGVSSSPREETKQRMRPRGGGCRRCSEPGQEALSGGEEGMCRREQPA